MDCSVLSPKRIILRWKRVCIAHNNCMGSIDMGAFYLLSLIYFWVPSSCLHSDQPLSEGEIIPFSGVYQVGGRLPLSPEAVVASHWRQTLAPMCNRRRPAATSSRRASFSALASFSLRVFCIERSNITLTHLHVKMCQIRQLQFSGIFVALGFVGNINIR